MSSFKDKFKHAFSVEPDRVTRVEGLPQMLETIARKVVDRGMETPAMILLESLVPLSFLGSQAMFAAWPLVKMAADGADYGEVARALEDRATMRLMADRIEELANAGGDL